MSRVASHVNKNIMHKCSETQQPGHDFSSLDLVREVNVRVFTLNLSNMSSKAMRIGKC